MNDTELIRALGRLKVETGSLACLGCGHEHSCGVHGCAVLRAARERIVNSKPKKGLPWWMQGYQPKEAGPAGPPPNVVSSAQIPATVVIIRKEGEPT